jgi:hypothetical protein
MTSSTDRSARCPLCAKPAAAEHQPFCSKRCADIDLHRWLSGSYAIPAAEGEGDVGADGSPEGEE